jgi:hypothetical protein
MNGLRISLATLTAALALVPVVGQTGEWIDLLPDESLKGWTRIAIPVTDGLKPEMQWRVDTVQRTLICSGKGGHEWLRSNREFGDFVLQADWRFTPRTEGPVRYNSGIGVRLSKAGELWYQAQTGTTGAFIFGQNFVDGGLKSFNLSKEMKEDRIKPPGEWNHYEITAKGDRITLAVNGAVVSEAENVGMRRGYIGFEAEGYEITFKNIRIKALE